MRVVVNNMILHLYLAGAKDKGKVVPVLFLADHYAMKAYWGSESMASRVLWPRHWMEVNCQLHAPAALHPGKDPLLPIG
jgi:hypothetical protein